MGKQDRNPGRRPWWKSRMFATACISTFLLLVAWVHSWRWASHLSMGERSGTVVLLSSHGQVGLLSIPPRHPAHAIVANHGNPMVGPCGEIIGSPVWYYLASLCPGFGEGVGYGLVSTDHLMDYWGLRSEEYLGWPVARRDVQVSWMTLTFGWAATWVVALVVRFRRFQRREATLEAMVVRSEPVEF